MRTRRPAGGSRELTGQLLAAINPTNIRRIKTGVGGAAPDSLNFHDRAAKVIAEPDALYPAALLPDAPRTAPDNRCCPSRKPCGATAPGG